MRYIVLDLEWNQSPRGREDSVPHLPFEIIEIGAVMLDEQRRTVGEFHRLIRPQVYRQLHFKISEVTHMNIDVLKKQGALFCDAIEEFLEWCGQEEFRFCTWGSMDLTELQRNMAHYGVDNPFPRPLLYYDVQKLYCLQYGDGSTKESLDQAVQEQAIQEERPFHRALDDAYYTGRILSLLDMERYGVYLSVDYYRLPRSREEEFRLYFPNYSKYVSRPFANKEDIMKDKELTDMICLRCGRMLRKKVRWFPWGQKLYLCLAVCPEHGYMRGKMRLKKSEYDQYYGVKTIKEASEADAEQLLQRREDAKKRRSGKKATPPASDSQRQSP